MGANLDEPAERVREGLRGLGRLGSVRASSLYRSEPVGDPDQPWYVNAVAELRTSLLPEALFRQLRALEREAGRPDRRVSGAPRVLDLDLLLYDREVLETADLVVPHPRMHLRRFVLEPLCEIAPGVRHPRTGATVAEMLEALEDPARVERIVPAAP